MKKYIIFLVVVGISLVLVTRDAIAGPPWRAVVRWIDGYCGTSWVDDTFTKETWVWGDQHDVTQTRSGLRNGSCHISIDYSSPEFASIADICANPDLGWDIFCDGNGNMTWGNNTKEVPIWCADDRGIYTFNTEGVATKSGVINLTCHFKP